MTRGAGGAVVVAVAALLVSCSADAHQEQVNEHGGMDQYNSNDERTRNLDPLGGGHLIRQVRATQHSPDSLYMAMRRMYGKQDQWPAALANYNGLDKRNFDEIDRYLLHCCGFVSNEPLFRSDLNTFIGKRNFDEIDQTSMPFPYAAKRFYHLYGNYLDYPLEHMRGVNMKRLRPDYPMDEIDLSQFPIGSKRSGPVLGGLPVRKQFDEADNSFVPIG